MIFDEFVTFPYSSPYPSFPYYIVNNICIRIVANFWHAY